MAKKSKKTRGSNQFSGIAGEYYVAAELSRRKAIATLTSKNTAGIDILAADNIGKKTVAIQVKTSRSESGGVIIGDSKQIPRSAYYVFVLLKDGFSPDYWIVPQPIVSQIVEKEWKNWIKVGPASRQRAPKTLNWKKHLRSVEFEQYHNDNGWNILGIIKK
ncbi:MAG: hypothetical protein HYT39_01685 [Candidatus Sungbacteria bacterium]|nr:hypothetical protein [Candidatus Sungbacteria bacterium]